jgi:hypothetical protein
LRDGWMDGWMDGGESRNNEDVYNLYEIGRGNTSNQ